MRLEKYIQEQVNVVVAKMIKILFLTLMVGCTSDSIAGYESKLADADLYMNEANDVLYSDVFALFGEPDDAKQVKAKDLYEKAMSIYIDLNKGIKQLDPKDAAGLKYRIGLILQTYGDYPGAIDAYSEGLDYNPENTDILFRRSNALIESGKVRDAKKDLEQIILIQPNHEYAYAELGIINMETGSMEAALDNFTSHLAINPTDINVLRHRGQILYKLARNEEALKDIRKAIALQSEQDKMLFGDDSQSSNYKELKVLEDTMQQKR